MAPSDSSTAQPLTRRALREAQLAQSADASIPSAGTAPDAPAGPAPQRPTTDADAAVVAPTPPTSAESAEGPRALAWVSASMVTAAIERGLPDGSDAPLPALLPDSPRRGRRKRGGIITGTVAVVVAATYTVAMLLWPLDAVAPTLTPAPVQVAPATASTASAPADGAAAVSVVGAGVEALGPHEAVPMASITKVVSSLVILDAMPLAVGEQGPEFTFPRQTVWDYLSSGESALPVPVGGTLTQYQLLQGTLIASAGNYIDRLAASLWPTDEEYAEVAMAWLAAHGLEGITVVDPSGIDPRNTASPAALIPLAELAMAHPVIAEIVGTASADLPGAGLIENTNALLADAGVLGIKTGYLDGSSNILLAKDIAVGTEIVRSYAAVLGQPGPETRTVVARGLFDAIASDLQPTVVVDAGTVVGRATTLWGESGDIVTSEDVAVIRWRDDEAIVTPLLTLGETWRAGEAFGSLEVEGKLDTQSVAVELAEGLEKPSPWWRLTHPFDLLGLSAR